MLVWEEEARTPPPTRALRHFEGRECGIFRSRRSGDFWFSERRRIGRIPRRRHG